jgi:hypothetical protein
MTTTNRSMSGQHRPAPAHDDPQWAAELLDTYFEGDLDVTIAIVEGLLRRLRKASKARRMLGCVPHATLKAAFKLRGIRPGGTS